MAPLEKPPTSAETEGSSEVGPRRRTTCRGSRLIWTSRCLRRPPPVPMSARPLREAASRTRHRSADSPPRSPGSTTTVRNRRLHPVLPKPSRARYRHPRANHRARMPDSRAKTRCRSSPASALPVPLALQRAATEHAFVADPPELGASERRSITGRPAPAAQPLEPISPPAPPVAVEAAPAPAVGLLGTRTPYVQLEPMVRSAPAGEVTAPVVQRVTFPAAGTTPSPPGARPPDAQLAQHLGRVALPDAVPVSRSSVELPVTVARSVTAEAVTPVLNAEETAYLPQPFASFADTGPEVAEVYELPTFPSPGGDATPLGPSLPQTAAPEHEPAAPEHEPALAQRSKTTLPALPIVQRQPAHDSSPDEADGGPPFDVECRGVVRLDVFRGRRRRAGERFHERRLHHCRADRRRDSRHFSAGSGASATGGRQRLRGRGADADAETTVAAAAAAPPGAPATGADVDELARRLFEPLSARLRSELWLDRERAGLMSDVRP